MVKYNESIDDKKEARYKHGQLSEARSMPRLTEQDAPGTRLFEPITSICVHALQAGAHSVISASGAAATKDLRFWLCPSSQQSLALVVLLRRGLVVTAFLGV